MIETLTEIPLLRNLAPAQLKLLEPIFQHFSCMEDTILFEQGEKPLYLYILIKGSVIIQYKPYDGPPINLTRLRRGDVFGWSAVIGSKYYTSGSICATHVEAFRIRGTDLWNLVREHPDTGRMILDRLASVVSSRWKNAHAQVQALFEEGMNRSTMEGGDSGGN